MSYDIDTIRKQYADKGSWGYVNRVDPHQWGKIVTYSAFKDAQGREPTDAEMSQYSEQASSHPDETRSTIMGLKSKQLDPLNNMIQTGGAPLLAQIAMGVRPADALASHFGISPAQWDQWKSSLDPKDQAALDSLHNNLNEIQANTDLKQTAVNNLVNDFPHYMADQIPKYAHMMDDATKSMMDRSLQQVGAKYAAGGQLSSGAMAEASARVGAEYGRANLEYGTQMAGVETDNALQNWQAKYNDASALRNFQQKMLGQGADQGFNAIQNFLNQGFQGKMQQDQQIFQADQSKLNRGYESDQQSKASNGAMWGALGQLGGTAIGAFAGPIGSAFGSRVGRYAGTAAGSNNASAGWGA